MSAAHGHGGHGDSHGGWSKGKWWASGILTGFAAAGEPWAQMTGIFGALFTGLFDDGGGGHGHDDHH